MYSRCSHCDRQQNVTTQQLRHCRGLLTCQYCRQRYDALASLCDHPDEVAESAPVAVLPASSFSRLSRPSNFWPIACCLLCVVFLCQLFYFEAGALRRQALLQPLLAVGCRLLQCQTVDIANIDDWSVSHSQLKPYLNRQLLFSAALTHHGVSPQPFPKLKITLLGLKGETVTERCLSALEYTHPSQLATGETQAIQVWLAQPTLPFDGFQVSIL